MKRITLVFMLCLCACISHAQTDTVQQLETVFLVDNKLDEFSIGQTLNRLSDSVIRGNKPALTTLLEYNTPIYFKQNGLGMVSSPSFRGTTASQTAVLWNGINVNSIFNGQTDFNAVNAGVYDNITVRAGGGSVVYGSGAIGGTVHLNTALDFKDKFENNLFLSYGSFNTIDARYRLEASADNVTVQFSIARNSSDNDYDYQLREGENLNGQFHNTAVNAAIGIRLNATNQLNFYSEYYSELRHFSLVWPNANRTKYNNLNLRNLLEWESEFGKFSSSLQAAFLSEKYKYYPDIRYGEHSYGKAETLIGKYDLSYELSNTMLIDAIVSHRHTNGFGSDIVHDVRNITSFGLLFKQQISPRLRYQIGGRKEVTESYESPFLYAIGIDYEVAPFYTAKLSVSKNFRRPTFNDLYWTNSGNVNLKAEESHQVELGNTFTYNNWELTLTGYFNDITEMIHWIPGPGGLFKPHNIDNVQTYGAEALLGWHKSFDNQAVHLNGTYAYTVSENQASKKQLIYVPYHKVTFSAGYRLGRVSVNYQMLFNGEVFTRSDNDPAHILPSYTVSNLGLAYALGKSRDYKLGFRVRNIFDKGYQNILNREMPGINFNVYFNLNF